MEHLDRYERVGIDDGFIDDVTEEERFAARLAAEEELADRDVLEGRLTGRRRGLPAALEGACHLDLYLSDWLWLWHGMKLNMSFTSDAPNCTAADTACKTQASDQRQHTTTRVAVASTSPCPASCFNLPSP
jgi:hypothetical protein